MNRPQTREWGAQVLKDAQVLETDNPSWGDIRRGLDTLRAKGPDAAAHAEDIEQIMYDKMDTCSLPFHD
ncbi:MAG: hypothetical protein JWN64_856 [Parcubacteria group bacterium]|nr:hypothetical protein [Parcubacteria group bacterium]